jgi:hypothetical protein
LSEVLEASSPQTSAETTRIVVLGMHRSGTSAVAGALCHAGAWAGVEGDLRGPDFDNERGFFERPTTAGAVDDALSRLGGSWSLPPLDLPSRAAEEAETVRHLVYAVEAAAPTGVIPLVKDPRLSLFANVLPSALGPGTTYIVCVRHPLQVARSLQVVNGLPLAHGLALWDVYNHSIASGLQGQQVHIVSLQDLVARPGGVEVLLREVMHPRALSPVDVQAGIAHVSPDLQHQQHSESEEDEWLTPAHARTWSLLAAASQKAQPTHLPLLEASEASLEYLLTARHAQEVAARLHVAVSDLSNSRKDHVKACREREALRAVAAEAQALAERQRDELTRSRLLLSAAEDFRREQQQLFQLELLRQQTELVRTIDDAEHLRAAVRDVQAVRERLEADVAAAVGEREQSQAAAKALGDELVAMSSHRDAVVTDLLALQRSESVRLGFALTWVVRRLLHPRAKP